ncbi:hypothetical protein niasHT_037988 [Heterodera trifolii]|uniref:Secreted protein n=1 Tax=Heterodera trifolii TaxID=157864 RepID=A0ABD2I4E9_9BILA
MARLMPPHLSFCAAAASAAASKAKTQSVRPSAIAFHRKLTCKMFNRKRKVRERNRAQIIGFWAYDLCCCRRHAAPDDAKAMAHKFKRAARAEKKWERKGKNGGGQETGDHFGKWHWHNKVMERHANV